MRRGDGGHQILGEREVGLRSKTGLGTDREKGAKRRLVVVTCEKMK